MANYKLFQRCSLYKQTASACLIVSYGTIIEYFTNRNKQVNSVMNDYRKRFIGKLPSYKSGKQFEMLEYVIYKHIHDICKPISKRGCDFLQDVHINNQIGTYDDCEIINWSAPTPILPISQKEIIDIKVELENNDSLVLVLYSEGNDMHAVVVGFDSFDQKYFCKDPNKLNAEKIDMFPIYPIFEYILFSAF